MKIHNLAIAALLLIFAISSNADSSDQACDEDNSKIVNNENPSSTSNKVKDTKSDDSEQHSSNSEEKIENSKVEKSETNLSNDDNTVNVKSEDANKPLPAESNSSQIEDNLKENNDQTGVNDNVEEKLEESDQPSREVETNKQKSKEDESNKKTSLSDVNSNTEDESDMKPVKRESFKESYSHSAEFLGIPRDASYFFDDLEPFINNASDARVGRAAPAREAKGQKSKLNSKGKENIEDEVDEDEEDERVQEDDEKQGDDKQGDEDEYDDDEEDMDSDCKPSTPACTTKTQCPTTTTPCPPPTTKCTTKAPCPTKNPCPTTCKTTQETVKCPRVCVKASRNKFGYPMTTERAIIMEENKKRFNNKKRKYHSRGTNNGK